MFSSIFRFLGSLSSAKPDFAFFSVVCSGAVGFGLGILPPSFPAGGSIEVDARTTHSDLPNLESYMLDHVGPQGDFDVKVDGQSARSRRAAFRARELRYHRICVTSVVMVSFSDYWGITTGAPSTPSSAFNETSPHSSFAFFLQMAS